MSPLQPKIAPCQARIAHIFQSAAKKADKAVVKRTHAPILRQPMSRRVADGTDFEARRRGLQQEMGMNLASAFASLSTDDIKAALNGGALTIYSVARPVSADIPVEFSSALAKFTFATPAFGAPEGEVETPAFVESPVVGAHVGTPGFARVTTAEGAAVADFSVGPGPREIKLSEVSVSPGAPVVVKSFKFGPAGDWPERPDYYNSKPKPGYALAAQD
jgi:hypothetical protein